jgi:hypothetical protein
MEAKELRIGNWYMFADNEGICYRTIKEIKHNEFGFVSDFDGVNFGICKPIPLTEEWLNKLGFELNGFYRLQVTSFLELCWKPHDKKLNLQTEKNGFTEDSKVKYVHELQNLYFALTGTELTIK